MIEGGVLEQARTDLERGESELDLKELGWMMIGDGNDEGSGRSSGTPGGGKMMVGGRCSVATVRGAGE